MVTLIENSFRITFPNTKKNTRIRSEFVSKLISNQLKFLLPIFTRTKEYSLSEEEIEKVHSIMKHARKIQEKEEGVYCQWNRIARKLYPVIFPKGKKPTKIYLYDLAKNFYDFLILPEKKFPKRDADFFPAYIEYISMGKISVTSARVFLSNKSDVSLDGFLDLLLTMTRKLNLKKYDIYFRKYFACRLTEDIRFSYLGKYPFPNSNCTSNWQKSIIKNSPYVKIFRYPNTDFSLEELRYDDFKLVYDQFSASFFDVRRCTEITTEEYAKKIFRILFYYYYGKKSLRNLKKHFSNAIRYNLELAIYSEMEKLWNYRIRKKISEI